MKKIDSLGLRLCAYQAALFQMSKESEECSSKIFIRRFMNSELAKRMDNVGFAFESLDVSDAIKEIEEQYGASSYGVNKFDGEERLKNNLKENVSLSEKDIRFGNKPYIMKILHVSKIPYIYPKPASFYNGFIKSIQQKMICCIEKE